MDIICSLSHVPGILHALLELMGTIKNKNKNIHKYKKKIIIVKFPKHIFIDIKKLYALIESIIELWARVGTDRK